MPTVLPPLTDVISEPWTAASSGQCQDLPTNPRWTLRALGTELQSQQKGYGSSLPSPSQGREGSHAEGEILTLCLNSVFSSKVMVSALAITGMMFTTLLRCFMNSRSKGRRLQPKKEQHGRGHFTLLALLVTLPASGHLWGLHVPIHPAHSQRKHNGVSPAFVRPFQALQS